MMNIMNIFIDTFLHFEIISNLHKYCKNHHFSWTITPNIWSVCPTNKGAPSLDHNVTTQIRTLALTCLSPYPQVLLRSLSSGAKASVPGWHAALICRNFVLQIFMASLFLNILSSWFYRLSLGWTQFGCVFMLDRVAPLGRIAGKWCTVDVSWSGGSIRFDRLITWWGRVFQVLPLQSHTLLPCG